MTIYLFILEVKCNILKIAETCEDCCYWIVFSRYQDDFTAEQLLTICFELSTADAVLWSSTACVFCAWNYRERVNTAVKTMNTCIIRETRLKWRIYRCELSTQSLQFRNVPLMHTRQRTGLYEICIPRYRFQHVASTDTVHTFYSIDKMDSSPNR